MTHFFAPNISRGGRVLRALFGLALLGAAVLAASRSTSMGIAFAVAGAFALYEALRGWCMLRACGIKTRL